MKLHNKIVVLGILTVIISVVMVGRIHALSIDYSTPGPTPSTQNSIQGFLNVRDITPPSLSIPTVVELPLASLEGSYQHYLMVHEVETDTPVYSLVKTTYGVAPITVRSSAFPPSALGGINDLPALHDQDSTTDLQVPTDGSKTTTTFIYSSDQVIISSSVRIALASNAFQPERVTVQVANPPSKVLDLVASEVSFNNGVISFPQTVASEWHITFTHTQPLRIADLLVVPSNSIQAEYQALRFLARPGMTYQMYWQTDGQTTMPYREYIDLESDSGVLRISAPPSYANPRYQKPDSDSDGVLDTDDNCPRISNADQTDVNTNGMGDACEDFDRDGYINSRDNCPNDPNARQTDTDADGFGDVCDPEESRLTERLWWLPWMGIVVGFGVVFFIFASTVHVQKRK